VFTEEQMRVFEAFPCGIPLLRLIGDVERRAAPVFGRTRSGLCV
jgi:hypothetical protein